MNPSEWPTQQIPHVHRPPAPAPAPPPVKPGPNVAAIIALSTACLGLIVLPILLGPVAVVAGIVGHEQARRGTGKGTRLALGGIVLGVLELLVAIGV